MHPAKTLAAPLLLLSLACPVATLATVASPKAMADDLPGYLAPDNQTQKKESKRLTARAVIERVFLSAPGTRPDLRESDLNSLDLAELDFKEAQLAGSNLYGTDLTNARLAGASLVGARDHHRYGLFERGPDRRPHHSPDRFHDPRGGDERSSEVHWRQARPHAL